MAPYPLSALSRILLFVNGGAIMYLMGGSIAGRRRLKTGPSAIFHRRQPYPLEGVMDVPSGTVSARPKCCCSA